MNDYQQKALRTWVPNPNNYHYLDVIYLSLALAGEAGELANLIKKYWRHGHAWNEAAIADELGDILWYVAVLADAINMPLADIAEGNIAKLKRRYPSGFSEERSRNRTD